MGQARQVLGGGGDQLFPEQFCSGSQFAVRSTSLWRPLFFQEVLPYPGKLVLRTKWRWGVSNLFEVFRAVSCEVLWLSEWLPGVDLILSTTVEGGLRLPHLYGFSLVWTLLFLRETP